MPAGKKTKENCNMSDLYSELLVKKERTAKDRLVKGSIIALIVLLVLAGLFIMPPLLIAAIVLGVCAYLFIFPGTDLWCSGYI